MDCADGHIDPNSRLERGQGQTICTDGLVRSGKEEAHTDGLEKVGQGCTQMGWNGKGNICTLQMNRRGVVRGTYVQMNWRGVVMKTHKNGLERARDRGTPRWIEERWSDTVQMDWRRGNQEYNRSCVI